MGIVLVVVYIRRHGLPVIFNNFIYITSFICDLLNK